MGDLGGWLEVVLAVLVWVVLHPATYGTMLGLAVGWHGHDLWERTRLWRELNRTPAPEEPREL